MAISRRSLIRGGLALGGAALAVPGSAGRSAAAALPSLRPGGPPTVGPFRVIAGSLHDHSTDSDGDSASEVVLEWLFNHRQELGIDYASLSDHSDFFPVPYQRILDGQSKQGEPDIWNRQLSDLATYDSADYSFVRGFEWTNDQENHLNVLMSQNWTSRFITGDGALTMTAYWEWLTTQPTPDPTGAGGGVGGADGIGMFNHPGDKGALNWDDYALDTGAAALQCLIEIHGDQGAGSRNSSDAGWYWLALAKGWHVSPVMNWDYHTWTGSGILANDTPGAAYGTGDTLPGQRSLLLAKDATRASMREAMVARRTSASETPDLWASLRTVGGEWQGSVISGTPGETLQLVVDAGSPTELLHHVEIISDNGLGLDYFVGDNADYASNHSQLSVSYVEEHAKWEATGSSLRKSSPTGGRYDTPPPGSVAATMPLSGTRQTVTIPVAVPTTPSPRPDGRHFFYAIVYAGTAAAPGYARAWTGPLLTDAVVVPTSLGESPRALFLPAAGLAGAGALLAAHRYRSGRTTGPTG